MVLWGKNCLNMDDFHHPSCGVCGMCCEYREVEGGEFG